MNDGERMLLVEMESAELELGPEKGNEETDEKFEDEEDDKKGKNEFVAGGL